MKSSKSSPILFGMSNLGMVMRMEIDKKLIFLLVYDGNEFTVVAGIADKKSNTIYSTILLTPEGTTTTDPMVNWG